MTPAQLTAFKTAINASVDAPLVAARTAGDHGAIATYYNAPSNPVVSIWKPSLSVASLVAAIDWVAYGALTVAKQNTFLGLTQGGSLDPTDANTRASFAAIFSGTSLINLTALAQRAATRFEALAAFVSVAGAANVSSVVGTTVTVADVAAALGS